MGLITLRNYHISWRELIRIVLILWTYLWPDCSNAENYELSMSFFVSYMTNLPMITHILTVCNTTNRSFKTYRMKDIYWAKEVHVSGVILVGKSSLDLTLCLPLQHHPLLSVRERTRRSMHPAIASSWRSLFRPIREPTQQGVLYTWSSLVRLFLYSLLHGMHLECSSKLYLINWAGYCRSYYIRTIARLLRMN